MIRCSGSEKNDDSICDWEGISGGYVRGWLDGVYLSVGRRS